jgi:hypothetical protein
MIANIRLTRPESLIFYPAPENNLRKNADRKALYHPEDRLWKLSTQIRRSGVYAHGIIRDADSCHVGFRGIR